MNTTKRIIMAGNFTDAGNFTGYTLTRERVHIPAKAMEAAGYSVDKMPSFPMFAITVNCTFNKMDAEGNPTEETFTREQATALFTNEDEMLNTLNMERLLDVKQDLLFKASAMTLGLSEVELNSLVEAGL